MTVVNADLVTDAAPRQRGHFGAWRAVTAVPAMAGSLFLVLMLFGWTGRWEGLVLLGWLLSGAVVFTRLGERIAVRVGFSFHRPTAAQTAALAPMWTTALHRCGIGPGDVELYIQRTRESNAYAAGGRSVAVTTGVLAEFQAHRLGEDHFLAVLCHELGHHGTRATRFGLVTIWLAAPWRFAVRLVIGLGLALTGRQPRPLLAVVIVAGVVVAVVQAVQQQQWTSAVILGGVAFAAVVCPLADAAISRRSEYAADRYAASAGLGPQLAAALPILDKSHGSRGTWTSRLLSRHPDVEHRIAALNTTPGPR
jgi:STE24 endopeptidase